MVLCCVEVAYSHRMVGNGVDERRNGAANIYIYIYVG